MGNCTNRIHRRDGDRPYRNGGRVNHDPVAHRDVRFFTNDGGRNGSYICFNHKTVWLDPAFLSANGAGETRGVFVFRQLTRGVARCFIAKGY